MTTKKSPSKKRPRTNALTVRRNFDASPKVLWSYWTDPDKLAKWFNPAPGMDLVIHEYDVRVGGRVRFDMPQPDGNRNPQEGVFHVLKRYREIVSGAPDRSFLIAVKLTPAEKRTRTTVTVTGIPRSFHEGATKGWNAGFDKLVGLLGAVSTGFTIERRFKAPVARLWDLWTTKRGVESWWGPEGFTTKVHKIEPRPGGAFEYEMTATAAEQVKALENLGMPRTSAARNVYVEVVPQKRLVLTTRIDFVPGVAPYDLTTAVDFRPGRGGTKIRFTSSKMHDAQWSDLARQGQESQFTKLAGILAESDPSRSGPTTVGLSMPSEREVLITRVFDAPRERVFRAHVDPRALERWWGPRAYATRVEALDVRPGGAWRIVQTTPEGTVHGFHGVFQEVVPPERLAWTFEYVGAPGHVLSEVLTFEEQEEGTTKLTVRALYETREDRDGMLNAGMEWGMRQGYERLDEFLARTT